MKTVYERISMKKVNSETINSLIEKKEGYIKHKLPDIFTDVETARVVGIALQELAVLKDARLLMQGINYKIYEKEGKPVGFEEWMMDNVD